MENIDQIVQDTENIYRLKNLLNKKIDEEGIDNIINLLCYKIWYKNEVNSYEKWLTQKISKPKKLGNLNKRKEEIRTLLNFSEPYKYSMEILDFLCLFAKLLKLVPQDELPKETFRSISNKNIEYDPAKNANNILLHNISFMYILQSGHIYFNNMITIKTDNEERIMIFVKGESNNIYSIICTTRNQKFRIITAREINKENDIKHSIRYLGIDKEQMELYRQSALDFLGKILPKAESK